MRTMTHVLVFSLALPYVARPMSDNDGIALNAARVLAGLSVADLPIALASVPPEGASPGIQAWTTHRADGKGERIFVYTESEIFRCASHRGNYQCVLMLASIIVHEAWHFKNGASEDGAYAAQIVFLMGNNGALEQISAVRMARDHALDAERQAVKAARMRSSDRPQSRSEIRVTRQR